MDQDNDGTLYKTIGDVWVAANQKYEGAYQEALPLRREEKPEWATLVLEQLQRDLESAQALEAMREYVTVPTFSTGSVEKAEVQLADERDNRRHFESRSKEHNRLRDTILSITGDLNKGRAHSFPAHKTCLRHWGFAGELLCGAEIYFLEEDGRQQTANYIAHRLRPGMPVLNGNHKGMCDHLNQGILLAIPILSQKDIVQWKYKQPYGFLIVCDTPATYNLFSPGTRRRHTDWATEQDLLLATAAMTDNVNILADSLDQHWEEFHSRKEDTNSRRVIESLRNQLR